MSAKPPPPIPTGLNFEWPFPKKPSLFYKIKSRLTLSLVYLTSKTLFCGLNKMVVRNKQTFLNLLEDTSKPLITVSNHRSNVDDPLFWHVFSFREFFRNIDRWRYTLTAHNICFTKPLHTYFFSLVDFCIDALSKNGWVHMFPEGKVTKVGIARLISESKTPPTLLPIWFNGMRELFDKVVEVVVGAR
uniref:Tafazzin family protein n=1 Tax=Ditylenchus dipsaci TaxID=166011 RepID=A0A915E7N0_9BILA